MNRIKMLLAVSVIFAGILVSCRQTYLIIKRSNDDIRQRQSTLSAEDQKILQNSVAYRYHLSPGHDVLADACIADYGSRDAVLDADRASREQAPKFYYYVSNGYAIFPEAAGLPRNCSPSWPLEGVKEFKPQREYHSVTGDGGYVSSKTSLCEHLMVGYEELFNLRLAVIRPDSPT